ncbi:MAG: hypothetical protein DLM67_18610 [Candidatus Nephthysia bennettiae]|uniref:Uncharacterized protein n=1 Tax=Candidatus Nephthysia bennettiae TaxID=3127016 RepID=A0A934K6E3_9BACT|nr:hypothetical protein [Candidatus Dormibacteraeota bacterium]MBJ7611077.1 hypothetical protein [Candidatus Dormibacteraeota bacterium]PZR89694.1 MAG: hypothetical protein DLM67_18610 [Candidatus Dormibacteraeota bacterium]
MLPTPALVARWLVRIGGLLQIVLGALFWTGNAVTLVPVHILVGLLLVIGLWTLAFFAARAGVQPAFVAVVVLWGLLLPIFGLTQDRMLTGDAHWVIRVLHLLVGLAAIGQGEGLAGQMSRARR